LRWPVEIHLRSKRPEALCPASKTSSALTIAPACWHFLQHAKTRPDEIPWRLGAAGSDW
jgi:hypothetical protein